MATTPTRQHKDRVTLALSPVAKDFIRFRATPVREFGKGGTPSLSIPATTAIERYAYMVQQGDNIAQDVISEQEKNYLRDILNGTAIEPATICNLWMEANDADSEYAEKWGINEGKLIVKLQTLPLHALAAIVEDVEAFWRRSK